MLTGKDIVFYILWFQMWLADWLIDNNPNKPKIGAKGPCVEEAWTTYYIHKNKIQSTVWQSKTHLNELW